MTDHTDDIRPRIDEHGAGWCDAGCPQYSWESGAEFCRLSSGDVNVFCGNVCPHHARRVAAERDRLRARQRRAEVECEAWRSGQLRPLGNGRFYVLGQPILSFTTITAAVDALMAEEGE